MCISTMSLAQWTVLGDSYVSSPTSHQSMAISDENVPYVAFKDGSVDGRTSVIKLVDNQWENVGEPGFSSEGFFGTDYHSLTFDSQGTPYVAFRDLNDGSKPSVMKFTGLNWEYVGSAGFTTGAVSYVKMAIGPDDGIYITFREASLADKTSVLKFNGTDWEYI
ncbi:MAG: hypothetical protein HKN32_02555, partial [Flavobacteriales bacterium]|nr:hypothetical protein [Flavobacteriales bacterium]